MRKTSWAMNCAFNYSSECEVLRHLCTMRAPEAKPVMPGKRLALVSLLVSLVAVAAAGQDKPPKPDIPFLLHANNLIETESKIAVEHEKKKELIYTVESPSSGVNTPMARPELVILSDKINPHRLKLYGFESKNGQREILLRKKKKIVARPYFLSIDRLRSNVFRIRVDNVLPNGEYCLTPDSSNKVFCFTVY